MRFGSFPETIFRKQHCRKCFGGGIEAKIESPVEHFDKKGKLLYETAVVVVDKARGIRCVDCAAEYVSPLWGVSGQEGVLRLVMAIAGQR